VPPRDDALDLRLLKHHLADEDRVRISCAAPGEIAPVAPIPGKERLLHSVTIDAAQAAGTGSEPTEPVAASLRY
jgi:hypothetical protein